MRTPPTGCVRCRGRFPLVGTYPLRYLPPWVPREAEVATYPRGVGYLGS